MDRELDRMLRKRKKGFRIQEADIQPLRSQASFNVSHLLEQRPEELLVFCNTVMDGVDRPVPWGDVFGLTDPPDTYRYLFTLYTEFYKDYCNEKRGEEITASSEDIILSVPSLTNREVIDGVLSWITQYYPALKNLPIHLEDPKVVEEMILDSLQDEE